MLNDIESIDLVSLVSYSVHAAKGDVWFCFAEFSAYEWPKSIYIIVMLSVRLYFLKRAFLKRFLKMCLINATSFVRFPLKDAWKVMLI